MPTLIKAKFLVYGLFDPITNKLRYVGYTSKSLDERLSGHLRQKRRNHRTNWLKSLKAKPIIKQLDYSDDYNEIIKKEIFWIRFFKKKGCNLVNATDGGEGLQGYKFTNEQKMMISERTKEAMTPEIRQKISDLKKGKPAHNRRKIVDDLGNIYNSLSEIGDASAIVQSIKNKRQSKGRSYKYYEEGDIKCEVYETKNSIAIKCNELNKKYISIREAARILNLDAGGISKVCKGKAKTCGGYTFSFDNNGGVLSQH
jgi:hypothetical protein